MKWQFWMVVVGLISAIGAAHAEDWPRFRGPNGAGVSDDKGVPTEWTATRGVKWKTAIPGKGNSSPIVSKGKVFLLTASDDQSRRAILCLDAATGKVEWNEEFAGGRVRMHNLNSPASSTPCADGQKVYAAFWDGDHMHLTAWTYGGKLAWKRDLGEFKSDHGAGLSPIVVGDQVIVNNDQQDFAEVQAFSAKTGEPTWHKARQSYRACYSTPFTLGHPDAPAELIVASTAGISSYNPQTGDVNWNWMWKFAGKGLRTVGSPIAVNGVIYAASGDGGGDRHMVALKAGGKGQLSDKSVLWQKKKATPYVPTAVSDGKRIYWALDKEGSLVCADLGNGSEIYSERLSGGSITASPIIADGKVYAVTDRGITFVVQAGDDYKLLAKNALNEVVFATPAVADGHLFIRGAEHLYCIGK